MSSISRRVFLKTTGGATVAGFAAPALICGLHAESPNERFQVGFVGTGPQGRANCRDFSDVSDLVALCDLDESYGLAPAMKDNKINRSKPITCSDYRRVLDRKDIDIVGIATPDHWHIKIAIEALLAGKHVFCEKPLTLTVDEGRLVRNAVKKSGKVFQVGTMQRSTELFQTAVLIVQKGHLGKIKRVICHIDGGLVSPPIPKAPIPSTLDWNTWLGQAPEAEYIATTEILERFGCPLHTRGHHEFRWFFDYAGGKFTDWGAHHVDVALWALRQDGAGQGPSKFNPVIAEHPIPLKDGYPTVHDQYQTASKFQVDCQMDDGIVLEVTSDSPHGNGIFFEGTQGNMHVSRGRIKGNVYENEKVQNSFTKDDYAAICHGKNLESDNIMIAHKRNMLACIRDGGLPMSDVFSNVQGINLCHIACIATRLGRELTWDPNAERFVNDDYANTFLSRTQRKGFEIPQV